MWYQATYTFTPAGWENDLAIELDESGMITDIGALPAGEEAMQYRGMLIPGFVNAHCHLELSGLKGAVPRRTGMAGFVQQLMAARAQQDEQVSLEAISTAMDAAWESGTVAIGDICNGPSTIAAKRSRNHLYTHSFIELLGLDETKADRIVEKGEELKAEFGSLDASLTLHAPYSVSEYLIKKVVEKSLDLLSIHLYESEEELALFSGKGGGLWRFLQKIPLSQSLAFPPTDPAHYLLHAMPEAQRMLWVHMAEIDSVRLAALAARFPQAYTCLCPRANDYIHGTHPDAAMFQRIMPDRICLGTDSLAGNDSLDMLAEIAHLQTLFPQIGLHTLCSWATSQGATALGIDDQFGDFVPGTSPGLLLISQDDPDTLKTDHVHVLH
ncbi:MAG: amidohydrolase family protein [Bacteroidia bacterium]